MTLADGTTRCRRCTKKDHYWDGTGCVPKTESHPSDPACSAAEILDGYTVYFSSYGGCRPESCTGGRTSNGFCSVAPSPAPSPGLASDPTPPTDVTADGHSPTDSTDAGQSVVSWEASDDEIEDDYTLARYELRYGLVDAPTLREQARAINYFVDLLPDEWLPEDPMDDTMSKPLRLSASTTEYTITGLMLYKLYRIEVMAVYTAPPITSPGLPPEPQPVKLSEWRHGYGYPTHDPLPRTTGDNTVGVIPIAGFRPADPGVSHSEIGQYRFVQCTNTDLLPAGATSGSARNKLFAQVLAGFATWSTYDGIVIFYNAPDSCSDQQVNKIDDQVDDDETAGVAHLNVVVFAAAGTEMDRHCGQDVAGCAYRWPDTLGATEIRSTKITLNKDLEYLSNQTTAACTETFAVAMHELGHAFGLNDTRTLSTSADYGNWPTVMSNSTYNNCEPTALDIAAMKAIYQSR